MLGLAAAAAAAAAIKRGIQRVKAALRKLYATARKIPGATRDLRRVQALATILKRNLRRICRALEDPLIRLKARQRGRRALRRALIFFGEDI